MPEPTASRRADPLQAWLLLLPALLVAWPGPGSPLAGVPTPVSAGTGWIALASLPAALLLPLRRPSLPPLASVLLLAVVLVAAWGAGRAGDPFAARRAFLGLASALVLTSGGASLGEAGRRVLLRGLVIVTLLLLLGAALDGTWSGVAGNTGHTAEAALPGALAGIALAVTARGFLRVAGGVAGVGLALYAGLLPVLAAVAGLAVATAVALLAARGSAQGRRSVGLGLATLAIAAGAFALARGVAGSGSAEGEGAPQVAAGDLGGIEFRRRTWARLPALVADHLWLGVGPGQFERAFPPYRDPGELLLSSHERAEPTPVEVEHAHNDWLEGLVELGVAGGAAWSVLLLLALIASIRSLAARDPTRLGLGLAALATLTVAAVNAPLLASPVAPAVAWPLLGAVLGAAPRRESQVAARLSLWLPLLAALLLLTRAPAARDFVLHGEALGRLTASGLVVDGEHEYLDARAIEPHLADALRATPDSVVALEKRAQWLGATGARFAERSETLERILRARPHRFGALLNLGVIYAREGRHAEAAAAFERAAELDPTHPRLNRNRLRLALEVGDRELTTKLVAELALEGWADPDWVERTAAEQLLLGRPGPGQALLRIVDPELDVSGAQKAYDLSKRLAEEPERRLLADGALATANLLWGRRHIDQGVPESAVRMYRQALRVAGKWPDLPSPPTLVELELAAAHCLAGEVEAARGVIAETTVLPGHWRLLPAWAGQALMDAELLR